MAGAAEQGLLDRLLTLAREPRPTCWRRSACSICCGMPSTAWPSWLRSGRRADCSGVATWLRQVPAVDILRRVWLQQYYTSAETGRVRWRMAGDLPPDALLIISLWSSSYGILLYS